MKNARFKYILLILFILAGCRNKKANEEKNWTAIEDGACYMEGIRAKQDFDKDILIFAMYDGQLPKQINDEKLKTILNSFNIKYERLGENCLADSNCYGKYMLSKISEKYGVNFIDSVLEASSISR